MVYLLAFVVLFTSKMIVQTVRTYLRRSAEVQGVGINTWCVCIYNKIKFM